MMQHNNMLLSFIDIIAFVQKNRISLLPLTTIFIFLLHENDFLWGGWIKCKGNGDLAGSNQELISYLCDRQPQCSPTNPLFCDFSLE